MIEAVVLTPDANHPLVHTIRFAFESFRQTFLHIHRFPKEGQEPHLEIINRGSHTKEKPNIVFLVETNGPQNTLPIASKIQMLTEQDPVPIIYVSKEKQAFLDSMKEIDEQITEPEKPSLGDVVKMVRLFEKRFPNAEKQRPQTPFLPPEGRRARRSTL